MQIDDGLQKKAARHARDNGRIRVLLNRYERACGLANGPDLDRRQYWEQQSQFLEAQLRQAVTVLAMQPQTSPRTKRRPQPHRRQS